MTGPKPKWSFEAPGPELSAMDKLKRKPKYHFEMPADATDMSTPEVDRYAGLPGKIQLGLMGAGNKADEDAYLKSQGYHTMRDPEHGLLWYNPKTNRWSTTRAHDALPGVADLPAAAGAAADLVGMGVGGSLGASGGPASAIAGAGLGTVAARKVVRPVARWAAEKMGGGESKDTRSPGEDLKDMGMDFVEGAIGEAGGRVLPTIAGLRPVRALKDRMFPNMVTPAAEAAARGGVPVTLGTFSEQGPVRGLSKFFRTLPTGGPMQTARENLLDATARRVQALGRQIGPDALGPGVAATESRRVARASYQAYQNAVGAADRGIEQLIATSPALGYRVVPRPNRMTNAGSGAPTIIQGRIPEVANLEGVLGQLQRDLASASNTNAPFLQETINLIRGTVDDVANNGGIDFTSLKRLRTAVGNAARQGIRPGTAQAAPTHARQLVNEALDADIAQALRRVSPQAEAQWAQRNAFIAANRDVNRPVSWKKYMQIIESGNAKGILAYGRVDDVVGPGRVNELRQMANQFGPRSWDVIARERWDRLGRSGPGAPFDAVLLLKNLDAIHPDVQNAIWHNPRMRSAIDGLRDLRPVLERIQIEGIRPPNPAGDPGSVSQIRALLFPLVSGRALATVATLGGTASAGAAGAAAAGVNPLVGAAGAVGLGGALGYGASRLLSSPAFGRWAKTTAAMPLSRGGRLFYQQVGRLVAIGKAEKLTDAVDDYLKAAGIDPTTIPAGGLSERPVNPGDTTTVSDTTGIGRIKSLRALLDSANMDLRPR